MYTNDKTNRITLRLNQAQFEFVKQSAEALDTSPSEFLRMVVNLSMVSSQKGMELAEKITSGKAGTRRENEQTDLDNIV